MLLSVLPVAAVVLPTLLLIRYAYLHGNRRRDMPTGPPTLPIIGNLHQIPKAYTHIKFTEWARQYGGLYTLKLGSGTMAVITDRRLVKDVVDKKSGIYSHRPPSFVSHDLITKGNHLLVMHYGDKWRTFRRLVHQHLMKPMVHSEHVKIVNAEAVQLVMDYMRDPEGHMLHPKRFSNSITNSIVFGIRTKDREGRYMKRLYSLMEEWSEIMETGATPPVDIFPWLKYIPESLFGNYVTRAKSIGHQMETLYADILNQVLARRESGARLGSFMDRVLDSQEKNGLPWEQLCFIGGVLMEGGSDTSSSLILAIVQALILNPDVQRKAHAEIDAVVGPDRSPVWEDMKNLPYINCIVKEGHRWRPILPLCFPHALGEDDWVDGKFLPKGTIVVINTWGMHMLENTQPSSTQPVEKQVVRNLEHFDPDRYMSHPSLAPVYASGSWQSRDHYGYGVGRRICPGIHLAERNLLLAIAKLIWAFDFEMRMGEDCDDDPVTGYHQGFLYCPKGYGVSAKVRSEERRQTVEREFGDAERDIFSQFTAG
ncbi:m-cresol methyl hydroxylase [Zopfia rhizophila CBS 207.26]|uniref:M-cresol methyl hydroxylase n=1 Tax=Zopfia rhizophila CBS 207.26 TaxID=1314779 RepID=A0A6A6DPC2_9PEZI|nr:m-cresol methyl hydroxylase [Zopfia rhizophila CBS 207.26]